MLDESTSYYIYYPNTATKEPAFNLPVRSLRWYTDSTCIGLLQYSYWITPVLLIGLLQYLHWITPVLLLDYSSTSIRIHKSTGSCFPANPISSSTRQLVYSSTSKNRKMSFYVLPSRPHNPAETPCLSGGNGEGKCEGKCDDYIPHYSPADYADEHRCFSMRTWR